MGAVIEVLSKVPLPDVPLSLLVAWAIWVVGGLLLMLWFRRRSAANRFPEIRPCGCRIAVGHPRGGAQVRNPDYCAERPQHLW